MEPKEGKEVFLTPEVQAEIQDELDAIKAEAFGRGKAEGAKLERERIQAVQAAGAGMPGHEKLVQEMMFDGQTTAGQASERILAAEKANRETRLEQIRTSAPKPVPAAAMPAPPSKDAAYDPNQIAQKARVHQAEMAAKGITISTREAVDHVLTAQGLKVGTEPVIPSASA